MPVVRFLLAISIGIIAVAAGLYLIRRDRRYLRFIGQVVKYTLVLLVAVMLFYLFERLFLPL